MKAIAALPGKLIGLNLGSTRGLTDSTEARRSVADTGFIK